MNALLYCTFNGAANCTNGIGRQTRTLLGALSRRWDELLARVGPFTPFLAIPKPGPATWAYDPALLAETERVLAARGGRVFALDYDTDAPFWSPEVWGQLSAGAAALGRRLSRRFDRTALIAVDTPFLGVGSYALPSNVRVLLTPYGTAHWHNHPHPDPARLAWEREGLAAVGERVFVADIGDALSRHLVEAYGVGEQHFVPCRSALDLTAPDLQPLPVSRARAVAAEYGVPLDRPLVLVIARTDPTKGVDRLIAALGPLRDRVHLAAIVVPFDGADPLIESYRRQIAEHRLRATLVPRFTRELPRALAGLPGTAVVACPSRGEALANVPLETALWARHGGPVVVAPALGGFPETIADGRTGLLYDPDDPGGLTDAVRRGVELTDVERAAYCRRAYRRVAGERDIVPALGETLARLFQHGAAVSR
ncbi:glycosyltransferase family 4 protein [Actinomadura atramentaria]|uniref:glycosyltransferase family 4 protein n=1 Tax=Actinomadura atramentaria TaxID=1990 RepID=UPI000373CE08|nr:glycosyltransferase family 4 protein [Actinomadura atramentaria]